MSHVVAIPLIFAVCAVALAPLAKGPLEKDGPFETFVGFAAIALYCGCLCRRPCWNVLAMSKLAQTSVVPAE